MRALPFLIWMLGWPLVSCATDYVGFLMGRRFSEDVGGAAALEVAIWAFVGFILWRGRNS